MRGSKTVTAIVLLIAAAASASAGSITEDGKKFSMSSSDIADVRKQINKCHATPEPDGSNASPCHWFHRMEKTCGFTVPLEIDDDYIMWNTSHSMNVLGNTDMFGLWANYCERSDDYKKNIRTKIKKMKFSWDPKLSGKCSTQEPVKLDFDAKSGTIHFTESNCFDEIQPQLEAWIKKNL
ncbi:MAG: hypothetical protein QM831_22565 [Kofleriaceae bacterium]